MRFCRLPVLLFLGVAGALCMVAAANAAQLKIISTLNIRPALDTLKPAFEKRTGDVITFQSQGRTATFKLVENGAPGDVVIGSRRMLEAMQKDGKVKRGSIVDIAHSSIGVVVHAGAHKPDISTDAKFKRALLDAKSIAYPDPAEGSMAGNYLARLIKRWGIAKALKGKTQLVGGGAPAGWSVSHGHAQLGINQIAEIQMVPDITFLTPLPPVLTDKVTMSAAVMTKAREPKVAAAWVAFLASPAALPAIKADGMDR